MDIIHFLQNIPNTGKSRMNTCLYKKKRGIVCKNLKEQKGLSLNNQIQVVIIHLLLLWRVILQNNVASLILNNRTITLDMVFTLLLIDNYNNDNDWNLCYVLKELSLL
jgi:hypothetical protein